jgi:hypothetical protein
MMWSGTSGLIRLSQWGRVVSVAGRVPWLVVGSDGVPQLLPVVDRDW